MVRVYLDLCCYKRPFDDPSHERVTREARAVSSLLDGARMGRFEIVRSPALALENSRNSRADRRLAAALWLDGAAIDIPYSDGVAERARRLTEMGFMPLDAFHVAFAEVAGASYLGTCDDGLRAVAARHRHELRVEVLAPEEILSRSAT